MARRESDALMGDPVTTDFDATVIGIDGFVRNFRTALRIGEEEFDLTGQ